MGPRRPSCIVKKWSFGSKNFQTGLEHIFIHSGLHAESNILIAYSWSEAMPWIRVTRTSCRCAENAHLATYRAVVSTKDEESFIKL